ncbi:MAG: hypothetical protein LE178_06670, partial [Endomicrobium sp.]|nr:hypothetical protein [Endomicrobium sp.]
MTLRLKRCVSLFICLSLHLDLSKVIDKNKRGSSMMTLRLKRYVSLFACLSLLLSACSPDKSSKAGSKVSSDVSSPTERSRERQANKLTYLFKRNVIILLPLLFLSKVIDKNKRGSSMMTLRLKRYVSLFACLSLLLSACSPDKSSKAG